MTIRRVGIHENNKQSKNDEKKIIPEMNEKKMILEINKKKIARNKKSKITRRSE